MADLKTLRARVQRFVGECPQFIIDTALSDAVREFLDSTLIWTRDIPYSLSANQSLYELEADTIPASTDVAQILRLKLDVDTDALGKADNEDSLPTGMRKPCAYFGLNPTAFKVGPTPDAAYDGTLTLALKPKMDVMTVPDFLIGMSGEGIANGAIAKLKMQEGKDWFDPNTGAWHGAQFNAEINRVQTMASKGFSANNQMARSRGFI